MSYRLVTGREDAADLASGFVLRSAPGHPAYPVRLARELFLRAASHLPRRPLEVWDPCCGSGYLLTVLGLLHREQLRRLVASDVLPSAVDLARSNLDLLTRDGLRARAEHLRRRHEEHGKEVHREAAAAAGRLGDRLGASGGDLPHEAFVADVFDPDSLRRALGARTPDLVLTDVPYGRQASWSGSVPADGDPLHAMVAGLCAVLDDDSVLAFTVAARKVSLGAGMPPLERFRVGARAAFIARVGALKGSDGDGPPGVPRSGPSEAG